MKTVVVYASHKGNTRQVAEAIAGALEARGIVHLLPAEQATAPLPAGTDLVIVGSPTEGHRVLDAVATFLNRLKPGALQGVAAAAFDTRLRGPRWLWGSAATSIADGLKQAGARVVAPPEGFFVDMTPRLRPGELARAAAWATALADAVECATAAGFVRSR
jgi:flavodoxin